jgi:hypothetical protein
MSLKAIMKTCLNHGPWKKRSFAFAVMLPIGFALLRPAHLAALDWNLNLIGTNTAGMRGAVAVFGNYAYVTTAAHSDGTNQVERGLQVIDISNPASPRRIGRYETDFVESMALSGPYLYMTVGRTVEVIDVSDPTNPERLSTYETSGDARGLALSGRYLYVAKHPPEYSYVGGGLDILDISNPANPHCVGTYVGSGFARRVAVSGNIAYVAEGLRLEHGNYVAGDLEIIDISNPANPQRLAAYDIGGHAFSVAVSCNYVYVADFHIGLHALDISNPATPQWVGTYYSARNAFNPPAVYDLTVSGPHAFLADRGYPGGVEMVDISNPASPRRVGRSAGSGQVDAVAVFENYLCATHEWAGLQVFEIVPANPQRLGKSSLANAYAVAVSGNYAYVADGPVWAGTNFAGGSLSVLDISYPENPRRVGDYQTRGYISRIVAAGAYLYVAKQKGLWDGTNDVDAGLDVIDVSNPASPRWVGGYRTSGYARSLAVLGNYAYLLEGPLWTGSNYLGSTLQVLDITDPANPHSVASYLTTGDARDVAVSDNYAFVAAQPISNDGTNYLGGALEIIDIINPLNPQRLVLYGCQTNSINGYDRVMISDNYAHVRETIVSCYMDCVECDEFGCNCYQWCGIEISGWVRVIDISNPANPRCVRGYHASPYTSAIAISGKYAYIVDYQDHLRVIDITDPPNPHVVGSNSSFMRTFAEHHAVTAANGKVFVAAGEQGLIILHEYQAIRFEQIARQDSGVMRLRIAGPPGVPGRVQRSADLRSWTDWRPVNFGESPLEISDPDAAFQSAGFYRLAVP